MQACLPIDEDYQRRIRVIDMATQALTRSMRGINNVTVQAYGSFVSGFYNSSSDLDICFSGYYESAQMTSEQRATMFRDMEEQDLVDVVRGSRCGPMRSPVLPVQQGR